MSSEWGASWQTKRQSGSENLTLSLDQNNHHPENLLSFRRQLLVVKIRLKSCSHGLFLTRSRVNLARHARRYLYSASALAIISSAAEWEIHHVRLAECRLLWALSSYCGWAESFRDVSRPNITQTVTWQGGKFSHVSASDLFLSFYRSAATVVWQF